MTIGNELLQVVKQAWEPALLRFIHLGNNNADMGDANVQAHTINPNASTPQRSFIIEVIKASQTVEVREGAELAYCHIFKASSFQAAEQDVLDQLAT